MCVLFCFVLCFTQKPRVKHTHLYLLLYSLVYEAYVYEDNGIENRPTQAWMQLQKYIWNKPLNNLFSDLFILFYFYIKRNQMKNKFG